MADQQTSCLNFILRDNFVFINPTFKRNLSNPVF